MNDGDHHGEHDAGHEPGPVPAPDAESRHADEPDLDPGAALDADPTVETEPGSGDDDEDSDPDAEGGSDRFRLPGRADVMSAFGRLVWRRRNHRAQRVAGEASARNAVHLGEEARAEAEAAHPEEPYVPDPEVAAFFDVDNTLIQGASILLLARGLAKHKFFSVGDIADMAWTQLKFRVSGKENADDVAAGREKALSFVKGHDVSEIIALSEEVVDGSMLDRVWPGTRALVQMHLDAGQQVWLVTATPVELARVIATRLGLSGALGTVAESVDGVYTGRLVGDILHGPGKAHAVSALAESKGFDLSKCYAYSDSFNDMPMLTLVGNPVAINPDSRLRQYARDNGWDVKDFRTVRKAAKKAAPGVIGVAGLAGATAAVRSPLGVRTTRSIRRMF